MKKKATIPLSVDAAQPYVMGIADKLSDDPMIARLLGGRFKVIATYDAPACRITFSFRRPDDNDPDDADARMV